MAAKETELGAMLQQAERVISAQLQATEASDRKTEQAMKLAIALFAFHLTVAFTFREDIIAHPQQMACGAIVLGLGLILVILAMYWLGHTYIALFGKPKFVEAIPNLGWLNNEAGKLLEGKKDAYRTYLDSLFGGYAKTELANQKYLDDTTGGRRTAMRLLAVAFGLMVAGGGYLAAAHFFLVHG